MAAAVGPPLQRERARRLQFWVVLHPPVNMVVVAVHLDQLRRRRKSCEARVQHIHTGIDRRGYLQKTTIMISQTTRSTRRELWTNRPLAHRAAVHSDEIRNDRKHSKER